MSQPRIVRQDEWLVARKELLAAEKEFTRQRDALSAARRALPMVEVTKEYVFASPAGPKTLVELFGGTATGSSTPTRPTSAGLTC
jgi:predicted dithiol-disulfide oxidoreductase (DUF899 family)